MKITTEFLDNEIKALELKEVELHDAIVAARGVLSALKQLKKFAETPEADHENP